MVFNFLMLLFFPISVSSQSEKNEFILETYRSVIPTLREGQKVHLFVNLREVDFHVSLIIQSLIHSIWSQSETSKTYESICLKILWLLCVKFVLES